MNNQEIEEKARAYLLNAELSEVQISNLESLGYFTAPASMRHHLNTPGGLAQHSINVVDILLELRAFADPSTAYKVGMLHDLVKCTCYGPGRKPSSYAYINSGFPGHGVVSALLCARCSISLSDEALLSIIWHMGNYSIDDDAAKEYQAAIYRCPRQILLTHAADHLASVYETLASPLPNEDDDQN